MAHSRPQCNDLILNVQVPDDEGCLYLVRLHRVSFMQVKFKIGTINAERSGKSVGLGLYLNFIRITKHLRIDETYY